MTPLTASLDVLKTLFFVLAVTAQYLFFFLLLPPEYLAVPLRTALFVGVFVVLAGYYLFEAEIRSAGWGWPRRLCAHGPPWC